MQEIHSIGGGGFLGGGGGDRRLRPQHRQNHQPLKCPRCDSLNTKFCYYNNYNLSQPRHFCKSCRRYWTKGGVLRNVPVGGGCRKSKRSKPKTPTSEIAATPAPPPPSSQPPQQELNKSNSHSSSESSSLTAADTEAASAPSSSNCELLENMHESKFFKNQSSNPGFETMGMMEQGEDCGIFSEIGSFTSLVTSTNEAMTFGFGNIAEASPFRFGNTHQGMGNDPLSGDWQPQHNGMGMSSPHQDLKMPEIIMPGTSLLDQTLPVDLSALQSKTGNGGFGSLDWQGSADQGLFDLPNTVDHAYWNHTNWTDQDNPSLFHLP